jgi:hypothetical protein
MCIPQAYYIPRPYPRGTKVSGNLLFYLALITLNRTMQSPKPFIDDASNSQVTALREEMGRIQLSGVLGEARLRNLFDYLGTKSLAGESPKEIAIAMDVFGKNSDFDVSQDALVRVYIHKLRKALEGLYASAAAEGGAVLYIPRGEYRLRVDSRGSIAPGRNSLVKDRRLQLLVAAAIGGVILLGIAVALVWPSQTELQHVRANPIWSSILKDDRPIMIVLGDYYLIGETDDSMEVKRLVREYSVNSKTDLDRYIAEHPEYAPRYMDVGLRYLPISAALALRNVMVVLAPQNRRITVSKMSDLEPGSLKTADIVYIGYLSGMGMFQDIVFSGSRFTVGASYDEVIDKRTHHTYISQVGSQALEPARPTGQEQTYHDYGIFEKLQGPGGNTIIVIAGTRDEGVSQTAEAFTSPQKLNELGRQSDLTLPLEALIEVRAFNGTNMAGNLLVQSNRDRATKQ